LRTQGLAQVFERCQRPVENLKLLSNHAADFRRLADPFHHRRRKQNDDPVENADDQRQENQCGDDWRDGELRRARGQRPEHQPDDQSGDDREQNRSGELEHDPEHDHEDADGRCLSGGPPGHDGSRPGLGLRGFEHRVMLLGRPVVHKNLRRSPRAH
jgi:hypothetical protein